MHGGVDPTVRADHRGVPRRLPPHAIGDPSRLRTRHAELLELRLRRAYVQFIDDPAGAVVDDCSDEVFHEQFELSAATAGRLFGTADGWGG